MRLGAIGEHDLVIAPGILVGKKNAFAELLIFDALVSGRIGAVGEL